jgi:GT2 family glycosyltransferase
MSETDPRLPVIAASLEDGSFGVVVIGRNEGERLRRCLDSVVGGTAVTVYVDSGSTDDSVAMARERGVTIVGLDMNLPFTAARARNAGFHTLQTLAPALPNVLFVDGDCEVAPAWPAVALAFLGAHADVAAVCGRRRERYPERSIYNRLCDIEWDAPTGNVRSCGGDVMMRTAALRAMGGYREDLIAGEEPELCVRLRQAGWRIWRLPDEMTLHDAALLRFSQWWKRVQRGGHAFAEGAHLHGAAPEWHGVRETARALVWGALMPVAIVLLGLADASWWWLALLYPLQLLRLAGRYGIGNGLGWSRAWLMLVARFAEASGVLKFHWNRLFRRRSALIEYK